MAANLVRFNGEAVEILTEGRDFDCETEK